MKAFFVVREAPSEKVCRITNGCTYTRLEEKKSTEVSVASPETCRVASFTIFQLFLPKLEMYEIKIFNFLVQQSLSLLCAALQHPKNEFYRRHTSLNSNKNKGTERCLLW